MNDVIYKCKLCGKKFMSISSLPNHMFSAHRIQVDRYKALKDSIVEELTNVSEKDVEEAVKDVVENTEDIPEHDDLPEKYLPKEEDTKMTENVTETIKDGVVESIKDEVPKSKEEDYSKKAEKDLSEEDTKNGETKNKY